MAKNKRIQIAFNHSFYDFVKLIRYIPKNKRIIIEAGTPYIKKEGISVINRMRRYWPGDILADLKIIDGAVNEVKMAVSAGAKYVTASGSASNETLSLFVKTCKKMGVYSVIDMLSVKKPMRKLWKADAIPDIVLIHRGRDEENSFGKIIQYKNIAKIKGKWDILVGAAGGIDKKELQSALFNGADIVVVNVVKNTDPWKDIVADVHFEQYIQKYLQAI